MKLYHVTTPKKAKSYRASKRIIAPVRGFDTLIGAMAWAMKVGRSVVYELNVDSDRTHRLPDHHNQFGTAYYSQDDVLIDQAKCVVSGTTEEWK